MRDFPSLSDDDIPSLLDPPTDDAAFVSFVFAFYSAYGRPFPWRETDDPYRILLSEVMLQQTQTERVKAKYAEFLELWPDFSSLAHASFDEILYHWRGLGYNRRALALHRTAKMTEAWKWTIPDDRSLIISLPGVGPSTASAIQCFSYHEKAVYLETNIRRVLLHTFYGEEENVRDKILDQKLSDLLPFVSDPKSWYYALMDYGVFLGHVTAKVNHRSSSYHPQSQFKGSDREIRGQIIYLLTETGARRKEEIFRQLPFSEERVEGALSSLVKDSLVEETEERYRISR